MLTNGYSIATTDGSTTSFTSGGGTSLSSPLWAGMWTRVLAANGGNLGFAAPLLYKVGANPASAGRDYFDITDGANGLRVATAGWDYTTGFGTAQVDGLICDIDGLGSGRFAAGVPGACSPDGQPALTGTGGGPGTDVPESPYAVLLLLAGLGAAGVALHRRRQLTD